MSSEGADLTNPPQAEIEPPADARRCDDCGTQIGEIRWSVQYGRLMCFSCIWNAKPP
jgi:formylmethanofuran dehydrogenase subunit E